MRIDEAIERWLDDLRLNGRAERTIAEHRYYAGRLVRWLGANGIDWRQMRRSEMHEFMRTVADKGFSLRRSLGSTMRLFWAYAVSMEWVPASPACDIKTPKKPRPRPRALSRDQIRRLLAWLASRQGRPARRNEVLIVCGLYTGCRAGELARLCWSDIDFAGEAIAVRDGKGGGRTVCLHPAPSDMLTRWQRWQALPDDAPVFSLSGRPIHPNRVGKICRAVGDQLGFVLHAHALRHSAATWAIRSGAGLWNVSRMLGHADTVITSRTYLQTDPTDSIAAVRSLPALEEW